MPATNTQFWRDKIEGNRRRDRRVSSQLRKQGWVVVRIKECRLFRPSTLQRIALALRYRKYQV
jgi:G:T-mismatch repair DNA endonuclease (very short patch repair protein)